jgi:hypothetical protein
MRISRAFQKKATTATTTAPMPMLVAAFMGRLKPMPELADKGGHHGRHEDAAGIVATQ